MTTQREPDDDAGAASTGPGDVDPSGPDSPWRHPAAEPPTADRAAPEPPNAGRATPAPGAFEPPTATPRAEQPGVSPWARPDASPGETSGRPAWPGPSPAHPAGPEQRYAGPPPSSPPPPGWHPPLIVEPPPPRPLPEQSTDALDEADRSARTVTYGIGMIAGAVMLVLVCLLCSRALF